MQPTVGFPKTIWAARRLLAVSLVMGITGCGSPMRYVRTPSLGVANTKAAGTSVPPETPIAIVSVGDIASRDGVPDEPMTRDRNDLFVVADDLFDREGEVVVRKGTPVTAAVTLREHRRIGRPGWVLVTFKSTQAVDGRALDLDEAPRLESPYYFEGQSRFRGSIALAVFTSGLGLLRTGGDVIVPRGSNFVAWTSRTPPR